MQFMVDSEFITQTLIDLVKINSVNPSLDPNGAGEQKIGEYIHQQLISCGWEVQIDHIQNDRVNVVGICKGKGSGRSLMINAHMDTVGTHNMSEPFAARIIEGKLYGRGAYDMKGSIAAMLGLAKAITDNHITLDGDLLLTFVVDEEYESIGTEALIGKYKTTACIVTEPTDLKVCLGHRGFGVYEITTHGRVAHGGLHKEGIDANLKMGKVLAALSTHAEKLAHKRHSLFEEASLHVPLINGGQSLFIYSEKCTSKIERRTLPGETRSGIVAEFSNLLKEIENSDSHFKAELIEIMWRSPYEVAKSADVVTSLCANLSHPAEFIGHSWWEDSGLIGPAGIETVIFGPKGGGIHQPDEWVDLDSVHQLSEVLLKTSLSYCRP